MDDLNFQDFSTVQNNLQLGYSVQDLDGSGTIVPSSFFTGVLNGNNVNHINPPVSGTHMLAFQILGGDTAFTDDDNIELSSSPTVFAEDTVVLAFYNTLNKKYRLLGTTLSSFSSLSDATGQSGRKVFSGTVSLSGSNPTNIVVPAGFTLAGGCVTPFGTSTGTNVTAYCTLDSQSGNNVPVYAWDKAGDPVTAGGEVLFVLYGS